MCPNCVLNQASIASGLYIAFGICGLFFVIAMAAIWWAFRNGEFEDMEDVKFEMMDDELDGVSAARARALTEKARLARGS